MVLLNGDEEEANFTMNNVIIPPEAKIMQYPLFVGWTPTRNIFKILASFQEKVDAGMKTLETDMTSMKVDMAIMKTLETDMTSMKLAISTFMLVISVSSVFMIAISSFMLVISGRYGRC